jgi:NADPH:quinone reductase-like Zn-dependent oxidoreductase
MYRRHGDPAEVVELVDLEAGGPAGKGEAIVAVDAVPLHDTDLGYISGALTPLAPRPPAFVGQEGIGRVVEVGPQVGHLKPGQRVFLPRRSGAAREQMRVTAELLAPAPEDGDPVQLSLASINPPTAWLALREAGLKAGDWLVQNAANSSCGRYLIALARRAGLRTVNVVRRTAVIQELKELGADVVLVDGSDLAWRIKSVTDGAPLRFALDAVGGRATQRLADSLADGATVLVYAGLSGEPCHVPADTLYQRDIEVRGFLMTRQLSRLSLPEQSTMARELAGLVADGTLKARIAATYPLEQVRDALAHQARTGVQRLGKVVLLMK